MNQKLLLILCSSFLYLAGIAQCTNTVSYGGNTAPTGGGSATMSGCNYAGEYAYMSNVVASTNYICTSSNPLDFLTIRQGTSGGAVIASGITPLSWTSTVAGNYFLHINTNASCGTENGCRETKIEHVPTPKDYCGGDLFTDNGGSGSDYLSDENNTWTICPDNAGDVVSITFTSFLVEGDGANDCYDWLYIYDGNSTASTLITPVTLGIGTSTTGFCYESATVGTANLTGQTIVSSDASGCITFNFTSDGYTVRSGWEATVSCISNCWTPSNLSASNITFNSADLAWTAGGSETAWDIEWGTAGFSPTGAPTITGAPSNSYSLTGLTEGTSYDYYVRADCGSGDYSGWEGPYTFTTPSDMNALLLSNCDGSCADLIVADGTYPYLLLNGTADYGVKFGKVQKHTINNTYGSAISGYQVEIDLTYDSDMKADFGDLRFYDENGTLLNYWIKESTASTDALIYVKMDLATGNNAMYMTYGNAALTSLSNPYTTMEIYDPMAASTTGTVSGSASLDAVNNYIQITPALTSQTGNVEYTYDFTGGYAADFDFWTGNGGGGYGGYGDAIYLYAYNTFSPSSETSTSGGYTQAYDEYQNEYQMTWNGTTLTTQGTGAPSGAPGVFDNDTWHEASVSYGNNILEMYFNGTLALSYTDISRTISGSKLGFGSRTGAAFNEHRVRNFVLRKYVGTLVTVTLGAEETDKEVCSLVDGALNNGIKVIDATGNLNLVNNLPIDDYTVDLSGTHGALVKICQLDDWIYYGAGDKYGFGMMYNDDYMTNGVDYNKTPIENATVFITDDAIDAVEDLTTYPIPFATYGMARYWNVNNAPLDGAVDVRFFYDSDDKDDIITDAQTFAATHSVDYEQFKWFKIDAADYNPATHLTAKEVLNDIELTDVGGASVDGVIYAQFDGIASFSGGTGASGAGNNAASALPVELLSFDAKAKENHIQLAWRTASELNNEGFEVERSTNGVDFDKIDFVIGNGTTNTLKTYNLDDKNVAFNTTYYYRLKQIDFDGQFEYSNIVSAEIGIDGDISTNTPYPNPTSGNAYIDIEYTGEATKAHIEIYNILGAKVSSTTHQLYSGTQQIKVNEQKLETGTYIVQIKINDDISTFKLVVFN